MGTVREADWRQVEEGPRWIPYLLRIESSLGIPQYLLARMAFQESSFREEVIRGAKASAPGALGIMQLMPKYFDCVRAAIPYTDDDVRAQILRAGQYLVSLYERFNDWAEALAAYNFGPGNEEAYLEHRLVKLPKETVDYVTEILADVPTPSIKEVPS